MYINAEFHYNFLNHFLVSDQKMRMLLVLFVSSEVDNSYAYRSWRKALSAVSLLST
jgi:hypothetical protein